MVTGELGDDGARLLVSDRREERRGAIVRLRADEVEVLLRVREVTGVGRGDGAARVDVRIDLRRDPCRGWSESATRFTCSKALISGLSMCRMLR